MRYALPYARGHANQPAGLSLGGLVAGIGTTALGSLVALQAGMPIPLVVTDIMAPIAPRAAGEEVGLSISDALGYVPRAG